MINKGKVLSIKSIKNANFFSKNKNIILIFALYLAGIICSIIFFSQKSGLINWSVVFKSVYLNREKLNFIKTFAQSFLFYLTVLALFFMAGTSVTGIATVPALVFILGFFMGGLTAYLYVTYSLKGIAFNSLIILPPSFIFIIACFAAAKCAVDYSDTLSKTIIRRIPAVNIGLSFRSYGKIYIVLSAVIAAASLLDAVLSKLFLKVFNF